MDIVLISYFSIGNIVSQCKQREFNLGYETCVILDAGCMVINLKGKKKKYLLLFEMFCK